MVTAQEAEKHVVIPGDCLEVLASFGEGTVDAIVTDPPYGLGFMGKAWDALPPGLPWARECLRVLKPGGHLLAFGGTRTWHRLAVAIEDAGFELRDSIAWLYGSGFPKSLDVSKAIDKAAGVEREVIGVAGKSGSARSCMTGDFTGGEYMETAPATPEAVQWQGWGTALKPAFEPIVVARKPLAGTGINVLAQVELSLRAQGFSEEIRWTRRSANAAARSVQQTSSLSTGALSTAGTSAGHADASGTQNGGQRTDSNSAMIILPGEQRTDSTSGSMPGTGHSDSEAKSSLHTETSVPAVASGLPTSSPSTTSMGEVRPTVKPRGARFTSKSSEKDSPRVTESFAGIATGLTGSRATVRIDRLDSGELLWPSGLPESVPGSPLTVAANVLEHGTGALNIDATRITAGDQRPASPTSQGDARSSHVGNTSCTCPSPEGDRTSHTPSTQHRASSELAPGLGSDLPPSARLDALLRPLPQGSRDGYRSSPCSDGELARLEAADDRASAQQPVDAGTPPVRCASCGRTRSTRSMPYDDSTTPNVQRESSRTGEASVDRRYVERGGTNFAALPGPRGGSPAGRWPANVVLDESQAAALDQMSGNVRSSGHTSTSIGGKSSGIGPVGLAESRAIPGVNTYSDSGGASRFFYCAKAPRRERPVVDGVAHPTVKPLALMRWLVRLVTPPGGVVLDPFAGSGTTLEAAVLEGFNAVGIERDPDYLKLIAARMAPADVPAQDTEELSA